MQASREKHASAHIDEQGAKMVKLSELLLSVTWGWNEGIRAIQGFSNKWLRIDLDQEVQDAFLRCQPYFDALEESSARLLKVTSSWDVFLTFCKWMRDFVLFAFFVLVELLHAFLLVAVAIFDLLLDLTLDPSKRKECYTLFLQLLRWLHKQYFEGGSVLTRSIFAALKKVAPHIIAYFGRPYTYVIQAMAFVIKRLAKMASDQEASASRFGFGFSGSATSSLSDAPAPLRVSAKAARKLVLAFRKVALGLWEPLVTNVILNDKNDKSEKGNYLPRAKL